MSSDSTNIPKNPNRIVKAASVSSILTSSPASPKRPPIRAGANHNNIPVSPPRSPNKLVRASIAGTAISGVTATAAATTTTTGSNASKRRASINTISSTSATTTTAASTSPTTTTSTVHPDEILLTGYTSRLSGRPGDTIQVHLSSQKKTEVTARLVRSICCDPNPKGPGVIEEDASEWFPKQSYPIRRQGITSTFKKNIEFGKKSKGSYAQSSTNMNFGPEHLSAHVEVWIYPTYLPTTVDDSDYHNDNDSIDSSSIHGQNDTTSKNKSSSTKEKKTFENQYVWAWGELALFIDPTGCIVVSFPTNKSKVDEPTPIISTAGKPLKSHQWYHVALTVDANNTCTLTVRTNNPINISQYNNSSSNNGNSNIHPYSNGNDDEDETLFVKASNYVPLHFLRPIDAPFYLSYGGTYNGKIEAPLIRVDGKHTIGSWDLSQNMSEWTVPSSNTINTPLSTPSPPLVLYNCPMRGVKGRLWDGSEFCWKHKPSHYAAIYFHQDDCYDMEWKTDFEWTIPEGIPSGIYILRLRSRGGNEEALPLFICPPLVGYLGNDKKKKVCILMSTFTYVMYGNHARYSDYDEKAWKAKTKEWKGYPHNPVKYPKYGLSTYNHHVDGTGICFASHKRPLLNLRPQYLTFSNTTCSGLRHFPADSHLIAWMHHHNIDYDIITDHELHKDGVLAIAGYQTLVTGTHPEYHTVESLNALQYFRDEFAGNIVYLGGDGFYWRVAAHDEEANILEIRRAEGGIRTWAAEPGEYYHAIDGGSYGGLWRNNNRAPQKLVGVGFTAQGTFSSGMPYRRICFDRDLDWVFKGIDDTNFNLGNFGFSGNGAAGFELDRVDKRLEGGKHKITILAQAFDRKKQFMFVPEDVLTTYQNLSGLEENDARRADMVYFRTAAGGHVFSAGSIAFCGSLPWNNFDNNISTILLNVINKFSEER